MSSSSSSTSRDETTLFDIRRAMRSQHDSGNELSWEVNTQTKTRSKFLDFDSDFERLVNEETDRGNYKYEDLTNRRTILCFLSAGNGTTRQRLCRQLTSVFHFDYSVSNDGYF